MHKLFTLSLGLLSVLSIHGENHFTEISSLHKASIVSETKAAPIADTQTEKTMYEKILGVKPPKFTLDLSEAEQYDFIYNLFSTLPQLPSELVTNKNVWKDLELLCGDHKKNINLGSLLNRTHTKVGTVYFNYLITHPIYSIETLTERQNLIKLFIDNQKLTLSLSRSLKNLQAAESTILSFWKPESEAEKIFIDNQYYTSKLPILNLLQGLNTSVTYQQTAVALNHTLAAGSGLMFGVGYPLLINKIATTAGQPLPLGVKI